MGLQGAVAGALAHFPTESSHEEYLPTDFRKPKRRRWPEPYTHFRFFERTIGPNHTSSDDNAMSLPLPHGRGSDEPIGAATVRERFTAVGVCSFTMVEMFEMHIRFRPTAALWLSAERSMPVDLPPNCAESQSRGVAAALQIFYSFTTVTSTRTLFPRGKESFPS